MIRITIISSHDDIYKFIDSFIQKHHLHAEILDFKTNKYYDIYFIEVQNKDDYLKYQNIKRTHETLIYFIGPHDFDTIQTSFHFNIQFYFRIEHFKQELLEYENQIIQKIQEHFHYYTYQNGHMIVKLRLSEIYYIESLRHQIIIHSLNGELHERKNLKDIINELDSPAFIQVHKSFIINRNMIQKYNSKEVYLKDHTVIPLGRAYKNQLKEYETS
ncbi:MAG: LytTR family DNA-binding domain-containing protein [Longibaculum muris]|uniref:LytTr DNA-binding domain-containing protein n=1 Tax=Longibaculum muris TaxID=1796628 RepID=A0A4R3Z0F4_9FIRM|nr:LytTR family DNA-binding domain-containing protein [Longibaculum muris]KXU40820.1 LytTr DNA-binding domain protein [Candidatus Stoquefichus sp. KLE1796]MBS5369312.1 LytTR family transcriptional regulator [Coprobacillus cateniformis]MCR1887986.1 LytTR family transcriptional regulator [Longibaculum muris]MED9812646.1 LytTR family DNA-binding domain-containing protein [Longibaculum muris]TCV98581.1 LytTr DNA-binding domain-containing protein [Longibaculum muris]